jgi:cytochrome P450
MSNAFVPAGAPVHRRIMSRLETALAARRNVLEIIPPSAYRQPIVSGEMMRRWHMLADPDGYRRVMRDKLANYPKSEIMRRMLRPAIGNSLFNADGAEWKWQRRAVVPVFTHANVVALSVAMTATAERIAAGLAEGGPTEMVSRLLTGTFNTICNVALSGRDHFDDATFAAAITRYFQTAGRASLLDFLGVPYWFPRPGELLAARSVETMHAMVRAAIADRRRVGPGTADDLLDKMMAAQDPETGRRMSPDELIHNMQFFIVAGHETTALALGWALYLLANSPIEQDEARAQARDILGARPATAADLPALDRIQRVLEETMRLYPPVGLLARNVVERDELCGRIMAPDDILFLPIWALHRHELWWEQPDRFIPARFDGQARHDKYQYLPFGAGPRVCVGADFAMTQATIILSTLLARFRFTPAAPTPQPVMAMTVRPDPGVFVQVEKIG